jgi:phage terminase large subunit
VDDENKKMYIVNEHYQRGMLNSDIGSMIKYRGFSKSEIIADSAEPKSIDELKKLGITKVKPSVKGQGSVLQGVQLIQQYELIIHPSCENFIVEVNNYAWDVDKKTNKPLNKPIDDFNHLMDALRYAIQSILQPKAKAKVLDRNSLRL